MQISDFAEQTETDSKLAGKLRNLMPALEERYSEWKKRETAMLRKFATLEWSKNMETKKFGDIDGGNTEYNIMQIA